MNKMETKLIPPKIKTIKLPNQKYDKKINLFKLLNVLDDVSFTFKATFDKDNNPKQNWVYLEIIGHEKELHYKGFAKIFSNGTITTTINLPDVVLVNLFDKIYKSYITEVLE